MSRGDGFDDVMIKFIELLRYIYESEKAKNRAAAFFFLFIFFLMTTSFIAGFIAGLVFVYFAARFAVGVIKMLTIPGFATVIWDRLRKG